MEELKDYLNKCVDNNFFGALWRTEEDATVENQYFIRDYELCKKISSQLNQLLLKVKRGEIGKSEADGKECG
jgi:hypothetical protein